MSETDAKAPRPEHVAIRLDDADMREDLRKELAKWKRKATLRYPYFYGCYSVSELL